MAGSREAPDGALAHSVVGPDGTGRAVEQSFRRSYARLVSALSREFGLHRLTAIEDGVQDALVKALETWASGGAPANPDGWLYRVAKRRVLDGIRRDSTVARVTREPIAAGTASPVDDPVDVSLDDEVADDELRMMFACCSPSLSSASQIALTLKILGGLSTKEIAFALLSRESAVQKRIERARAELARVGELIVPSGAQLEERLDAMHHVLYLLFNEGHSSGHPDGLVRRDLCHEAMRLTRLLAEHPVTGTPATWALLALQHFHLSRLPERVDAEGRIVLLADQDRSGWDAGAIREGFRCLDRSAAGQHVTRYHVEAAIAAEHCRAPSVDRTDWRHVVDLYDHLREIAPSPVHDLNRAVAVMEASGPEAALEALESIEGRAVMSSYYLLHAVEAECHRRKGDFRAAERSLLEALRWARSEPERALLGARLEACRRRLTDLAPEP